MNQDGKEIIKTKNLSLEEINKILVSNDVEKFIKVEETAYFECRENSYLTFLANKFDAERNKLNLVKDVTSIANSGGGYICIGLVTLLKTNEKTEYVKEIKSAPSEHIKMQDWEDILASYTIPKFKREWLEYGYSGKDKKIFWIKIADIRQSAEFPILVSLSKKYEEGLSTTREVFGFYQRDRSVNVSYSPEKIHSFIQNGLKDRDKDSQNRYLKSMLEAIDTKFDLLLKKVNKENFEQIKRKALEEVTTNASQKLDSTKGIFYLYAFPKNDKVIKNFWDQGDKSVYHFIKNPPYLRNYGWDLRVAMSEYPYPNNNKWEITNGNRKLTSYDIKGRLFSAGSIEGFLNWGVQDYKEDEEGRNLVNAFALTEYIDTFFHTLEVFRTVFDAGGDFEVEAGFINIQDNTALLFPAHIITLFYGTTNNVKRRLWSFSLNDEELLDPEVPAGRLVQEIYVNGFSYVGRPNYPYLTKDEKGYKVNKELYTKRK